MGFLMAAVYDRVMARAERARLSAWRRELLADLAGEVLEVGAGTGANAALYPPAVTRVTLSEPDAAMRRRMEDKVAQLGQGDRLRVDGSSLTRLGFDDASFDAAVSTLVLCSTPDLAGPLAELHRVLRPGGRLVFLEHVASDERGHLRYQCLLEPGWRRLAGNCHLTRRTDEAIAAAGFTIEHIERVTEGPWLGLVRKSVRGVARRA